MRIGSLGHAWVGRGEHTCGEGALSEAPTSVFFLDVYERVAKRFLLGENTTFFWIRG